MNRLFIVLLAALVSCKETISDHPIFKYYPPSDVIEDGYVSKYYEHYYPKNTDRRAWTRIYYTRHIRLDESQYILEEYSAGFDIVKWRLLSVEGDSVILEKGYNVDSYDVTDTTEMQFLSKTVASWESELVVPFQLKQTFDDEDYIYTEYQDSYADTTIEGKPAKVFKTSWNYKLAELDSTVSEGISTNYFVKGLGFYGSETERTNTKTHTELVEQMSVEEFERRADHGEHRVAWIDPDNTMSDDSDFRICGHERSIADYYNSTPDGRYVHSKRALLDTVYSNLDESKLFDQSGRLVFRFVVNCDGVRGRFIARGYDLNYQPMQFETETVDHLFDIIQKLKEWRPVVIRDEARDAYFYITFNIEDGEIQDILP